MDIPASPSQNPRSNGIITDVGDSSSEDDMSPRYYNIRGSSTSGTSVTSPSSRNSVVVALDDVTKSFVLLLVLKASRYDLASIDVTDMTARDFFKTIVQEYNEKRGVWRRFFSIFVYSHCDFMKVSFTDRSSIGQRQ